VYFRHSAEGKVMVILNKNTSEKTLDLSRFREILPAGTVAKDAITEEKVILGASFILKAKSVIVLEF
jgi:hypothetical protein